MDKAFLGKFIRFCIVGFLSFIVDFSLTYICKEKLHWNKYIANTTGFLTSSIVNFVLNRIWAFNSKDEQMTKQAVLFAISTVAGLVLGNGMVYLFADLLGIHFYIAKLISIAVMMIWNFTFNDLVIFKK
jgi:putative flippase GtrA